MALSNTFDTRLVIKHHIKTSLFNVLDGKIFFLADEDCLIKHWFEGCLRIQQHFPTDFEINSMFPLDMYQPWNVPRMLINLWTKSASETKVTELYSCNRLCWFFFASIDKREQTWSSTSSNTVERHDFDKVNRDHHVVWDRIIYVFLFNDRTFVKIHQMLSTQSPFFRVNIYIQYLSAIADKLILKICFLFMRKKTDKINRQRFRSLLIEKGQYF